MKKNTVKTAALILNGSYIPPQVKADYILCADGGYNLAKRAGLRCDTVIGDMDSAADLDPGVESVIFDRVKDETDGQLAALHLLNAGYKKIDIYGALGGRPDHVAANINLLALISSRGAKAVIYDEGVEIHFITGVFGTACLKGDIISILPYTDSITFTESRGLLYPLNGLTVERFSSRGISNIAAESNISISIKSGQAFLYRIINRNV